MSNVISELTATLRSDAVRLALRTGETKDITYTDFLKYIQTHVGILNDEVKSATLTSRFPKSCIWMKISKNSIQMYLYFPESKETLQFLNRKYENCVTPNILVQLTMNPSRSGSGNPSKGADRDNDAFPTRWYINDARWYCTTHAPENLELPLRDPSPGQQIWHLPFGNIYNDARMCTGSNSYPEVMNNDFRILDSLFVDIFVRGVFNHDLGPRHVRVETNNEEIIQLYSKCYRFPYEILSDYKGPYSRQDSRNAAVAAQNKELLEKNIKTMDEIRSWFKSSSIPLPGTAEEIAKDKKIIELNERLDVIAKAHSDSRNTIQALEAALEEERKKVSEALAQAQALAESAAPARKPRTPRVKKTVTQGSGEEE